MGAGGALGVTVRVKDADLSILRAAVGIEGLSIANPPGYKHEHLLKLKECRASAKIGSLLTDTVVLNKKMILLK